jgi:hypothetical protein
MSVLSPPHRTTCQRLSTVTTGGVVTRFGGGLFGRMEGVDEHDAHVRAHASPRVPKSERDENKRRAYLLRRKVSLRKRAMRRFTVIPPSEED